MGVIIKFRKDYASTFTLDIIIISAEERGIIILVILMMIRINKRLKLPNLINIIVRGKSLNFNFSSLLYGFGIIRLMLIEENRLFMLPI